MYANYKEDDQYHGTRQRDTDKRWLALIHDFRATPGGDGLV